MATYAALHPDGQVLEILGRESLDHVAFVCVIDGQPAVSGPGADLVMSVNTPNRPEDGDAWLAMLGRLIGRGQPYVHRLLPGDTDLGSDPLQGPGAVEKGEPLEILTTIAKADTMRRIALGVVLAPRPPHDPDLQGDWYTAEDIEHAAYGFMAAVARGEGFGDLMHDDVTKAGYPVESFIAPVDFQLGEQLVRAGSWVVGMHYPDDDVWKRVESGELSAFSVGGFGMRSEN